MLSFFKKIILIYLLFCGKCINAQIKFTASLSSTQISKNELVQLKLSIENTRQATPIIIPPVFKDFDLVRGPYHESNIVLRNGELKEYHALNYVLKPKAVGNFTILPANAKADGQFFKSNAVSIKVTNTLVAKTKSYNFNTPLPDYKPRANAESAIFFTDNILKSGEDITDKINNNMFVQVDVDKTSAYVGEPIVATYKLYTRLKSESIITKTPSFNGFSVIDLQPANYGDYDKQKVNGKNYYVYIISKSQLYPLQTGNVELGKTEVENNITFIKEAYLKNKNAIGNDLFKNIDTANIPPNEMVKQKLTIQNKPLFVNIKPLPIINSAANFKGAVGNFTISSILQKNNFTTDDVVKLKVIISGNGNFQLINPPQIEWPQGFENFEPSIAEDFNKKNIPLSGKKTIDYSFTIAKPGIYILPTITFTFFNVGTARYITDSTKPIVLTVTKGVEKKELSNNKASKQDSNFFNIYKWIACGLVCLIMIAVFFWFIVTNQTQKDKIIKSPTTLPLEANKHEETTEDSVVLPPINWLAQAQNYLYTDNNTFYNELNLGLKKYLSTKLNLPVAIITKKNIAIALHKKNIDNNVSLKLQQIITDIEMQLYTPFADKEKMQELYYDTQKIIRLLDTLYK